MNLRPSIGSIRKVASGLVAFVLLFLMFANAFPTPVPDCCNGKMCPIQHKHIMPAKASENSHMDCEHEGMGLLSCSMSYGHSADDQGLQTTAVFLLPDGSTAAALISVERALLSDLALSSDLAIRPLTPPPRFLSSQ